MSDKTEYLTQEKFDELGKELELLKTVRRKEVAESLGYAKSLGDLAENAEYHEAREEQANVEDRIAKLEQMLKSSVIMKLQHSDVAGIGSTVHLERGKDSKGFVYKIVGSEEADLSQNKLSIHSPLGEAIVGKKKGDHFEAKTPNGVVGYRITDIE